MKCKSMDDFISMVTPEMTHECSKRSDYGSVCKLECKNPNDILLGSGDIECTTRVFNRVEEAIWRDSEGSYSLPSCAPKPTGRFSN